MYEPLKKGIPLIIYIILLLISIVHIAQCYFLFYVVQFQSNSDKAAYSIQLVKWVAN